MLTMECHRFKLKDVRSNSQDFCGREVGVGGIIISRRPNWKGNCAPPAPYSDRHRLGAIMDAQLLHDVLDILGGKPGRGADRYDLVHG